ncbi:hypothetical protein CYMTET_32937 [Cymbomonas tetramitiformis]|uniref:Uncharacterized protein n=1 Tax=Cymbomonas tetramitiformis TaxID=36881 RepID=A0AAE0FEP1_9CHLO|nr:hypothetical protein CYMTET_32937 [Cymbomonas tetramitiformis]
MIDFWFSIQLLNSLYFSYVSSECLLTTNPGFQKTIHILARYRRMHLAWAGFNTLCVIGEPLLGLAQLRGVVTWLSVSKDVALLAAVWVFTWPTFIFQQLLVQLGWNLTVSVLLTATVSAFSAYFQQPPAWLMLRNGLFLTITVWGAFTVTGVEPSMAVIGVCARMLATAGAFSALSFWEFSRMHLDAEEMKFHLAIAFLQAFGLLSISSLVMGLGMLGLIYLLEVLKLPLDWLATPLIYIMTHGPAVCVYWFTKRRIVLEQTLPDRLR